MVDLARHLRRREPVDESAPVQKGRVELLGPGPDDPRCACPGACMLFGHVAALLDLGQIRREYLTGEQVRSRPRPCGNSDAARCNATLERLIKTETKY